MVEKLSKGFAMNKSTLAIAVAMAFSPVAYANTLNTVVVTDQALPMASDSRSAESRSRRIDWRLVGAPADSEILPVEPRLAPTSH